MNSDIVIKVIDWFVSICETQRGKRPWLMEKEGGKTQNNYFCQLSRNSGYGHRSEKIESVRHTLIKVQRERYWQRFHLECAS